MVKKTLDSFKWKRLTIVPKNNNTRKFTKAECLLKNKIPSIVVLAGSDK